AVYEMSQVKENVVFGVPDDAMGEELALVLHVHEGESLTEEELRDFLKDRIAGYKVPRHIQFWDHPLPQNASGKLHKLNVRKAFLGED
ncbi:MAG: AMP-binding enzyme, partial [Halioglobus sp.]